jgi:hypothetical protein
LPKVVQPLKSANRSCCGPPAIACSYHTVVMIAPNDQQEIRNGPGCKPIWLRSSGSPLESPLLRGNWLLLYPIGCHVAADMPWSTGLVDR